MNRLASSILLVCCASPAFAAVEVRYTEEREACADRSPTRNAYFGDLHVHTSWSFDAYSNGTRTSPTDAYAFARGKVLELPPYDADGNSLQSTRIDRPLDFMAVTDHGETLGEVRECTHEDREGYASESCARLRRTGPQAFAELAAAVATPLEPFRVEAICGEGGKRCAAEARGAWADMQKATEAAYDRSSACSFTTFHGYEYTGTPESSNLHRNVIFRNHIVPDTVVSYVDAPVTADFWAKLAQVCTASLPGCDVIAIPHNSNLSNGRMFPLLEQGDLAAQKALAERAQVTEPLIEIFQHKAASECSSDRLAGLIGEPDELCDFEQVRTLGTSFEIAVADADLAFEGEVADCESGTGRGGMLNAGCVSSADFARGALARGLQEEKRLGVNPYKLGIIASTDTHLSNPGDVAEATWKGHIGYETTFAGRLASGFMPTNRQANPGGLAGVWAVENSRDAIFDAFERREVFGTSGPRIQPRFFAGWEIPEDACDQQDFVKLGYEQGVPMGGDLAAPPKAAAKPRFLAAASRDSASDAAPLERLQLVKGWIDAEGAAHFSVTDIAGEAGGKGRAQLCAAFSDEGFDAGQSAYYYLRVVEVPTQRWDTLQCEAAGDEAPAACGVERSKPIRERAWSSPIWYRP